MTRLYAFALCTLVLPTVIWGNKAFGDEILWGDYLVWGS